MKTTITIIIIIIIGLGIYFFVNNKSTPTPMTSSSPDSMSTDMSSSTDTMSMTASTSPASEITVHIKNFKYDPTPLTIKAGTKVTWVNDDTAPHTVTSDPGSLLNSPKLATGESWSFTFAKAGTENYHCTVHPMMKAQVIVQ